MLVMDVRVVLVCVAQRRMVSIRIIAATPKRRTVFREMPKRLAISKSPPEVPSCARKQPTEVLSMCTQQADSRPYADCNFLRKPFLEACQMIRLI